MQEISVIYLALHKKLANISGSRATYRRLTDQPNVDLLGVNQGLCSRQTFEDRSGRSILARIGYGDERVRRILGHRPLHRGERLERLPNGPAAPFCLGVAIAVIALLLSLILVRETQGFALLESSQLTQSPQRRSPSFPSSLQPRDLAGLRIFLTVRPDSSTTRSLVEQITHTKIRTNLAQSTETDGNAKFLIPYWRWQSATDGNGRQWCF
jgi:hypothetical protein